MASLWFKTDLASRYEIALEFDHVSLQSWELSNRTLNALLSFNFKMTVGDVIRANKSLTTIQGLSRGSIEELNTKVSQLLAETGNIKAKLSTEQSSIHSNSEASEDLLIKILTQSVQSFPLDQLHLDLKTHNALIRAGIITIGDLYNISNTHLSVIQGFHLGSLGNVNGSLISLLNSINPEGDVDWFQYWKALNIQVLPSTCISSSDLEHIIKELPKLIEEILLRERDERLWTIIQRRFGLGKAAKLTLEDIGNAYGGLSRERIRQLEEKALIILRQVIVEQHYGGKDYHVHPVVHFLLQTICSTIEAKPSKLILETELFERVGQTFNIDLVKVKSSLFLTFSLIGIQRIEFDYPKAIPAWGYVEPVLRKILERGIKHLDELLTRETSLSHTEFDLL